jgi:hypothetical protein
VKRIVNTVDINNDVNKSYDFKTILNVDEFEVLVILTMKSAVFWDVTPCSLVNVSEEHTTSIFRAEE